MTHFIENLNNFVSSHVMDGQIGNFVALIYLIKTMCIYKCLENLKIFKCTSQTYRYSEINSNYYVNIYLVYFEYSLNNKLYFTVYTIRKFKNNILNNK